VARPVRSFALLLLTLHAVLGWGAVYFPLCNELTPKIPCGFSTKLGNFGHSWRNHFPPKIKFKK
jgi:hypothetical protein